MYDFIIDQIIQYTTLKSDGLLTVILAYGILILGLILLSVLVDQLVKGILLRIIKKIIQKTKTQVDDVFYKRKVFHRIAHITPALIFYGFSESFHKMADVIQKASLIYSLLIIIFVIFGVLDASNDLYNLKAYSKNRPIKGLLQVVKIIIIIFAFLFVLSIMTNSGTVTALLGGLGGMTAVLLLIFRDSILGLVAGIQLSTDRLLAIGDWIDMPKYDADGAVIDISLTKIVVRNWDNTITSIPAYKFLEDSFKNWRSMSESGGRRIKRAISINVNSIKFLTEADIEKLSKIHILKDYLMDKQKELRIENDLDEKPQDLKANGRYLTNIGTFRAYICAYLKRHPMIHDENFILMARQLTPTATGIPIEVYCFAKETAWLTYESIQSDIFDHLLAVIGEFDLKLYQSPSGDDFKQLIK